MLLLAPLASAEEIVAILDLKFIEDTGEAAVFVCGDDEPCGTWATYYLFEANVDRVISGELPTDRFRVLYGQHALKQNKYFRNVVTLL